MSDLVLLMSRAEAAQAKAAEATARALEGVTALVAEPLYGMDADLRPTAIALVQAALRDAARLAAEPAVNGAWRAVAARHGVRLPKPEAARGAGHVDLAPATSEERDEERRGQGGEDDAPGGPLEHARPPGAAERRPTQPGPHRPPYPAASQAARTLPERGGSGNPAGADATPSSGSDPSLDGEPRP